MHTLKFGDIYFKKGPYRGKLSNSPDGHYLVVLGVDKAANEVLYQTLGTGLNKVFHFPNESKPPLIDVDTVSFLNYRKYGGLLSHDTCIMMFYGVDREQLPVFSSARYRRCGALSDHNRRALMVSLIPSRSYKLSGAEYMLIGEAYQRMR